MLNRTVHIGNVWGNLSVLDLIKDGLRISLNMCATEFSFLLRRETEQAIEARRVRRKESVSQGLVGHLAAIKRVRFASKPNDPTKVPWFDDRPWRQQYGGKMEIGSHE